MLVRDLDDGSFKAGRVARGLVVIDFWAPWCGPCRVFEPVFAASSEANVDVEHVKVNVDVSPELARAFSIQAVPTTVFLRDGVPVGRVAGAMGAARLAELIGQMRQSDALPRAVAGDPS